MSAAPAGAVESMAHRLADQRLAVERDARLRTSLLVVLLQTTRAPETRRRAAGSLAHRDPDRRAARGGRRRGAAGGAARLGEAGDAARLAATRTASGYFVHVDRLGPGRLLLA